MTSPAALPILIRPEAVAEALGVSRVMVYKLAASGALPSVRIGSALRFDPADVAAFIEARRGARQDKGTAA